VFAVRVPLLALFPDGSAVHPNTPVAPIRNVCLSVPALTPTATGTEFAKDLGYIQAAIVIGDPVTGLDAVLKYCVVPLRS
jgi:hypothetical protein